MKKYKIILPFFLTVIILVIIYFTFYRDVQLLGGLKTSYDSNEILHKAELFIHGQNIRTGDLKKDCSLQANNELIRQVENNFGYKKGNELLRNSLPGFYWKIKWDKTAKSNVSFGFSNGEDMSDNNMIRVIYDSHGNIIEFYMAENDSAEAPSLEGDLARKTAKNFLSPFFKFEKLDQDDIALDSVDFEEYSLISASGEVLHFSNEKSTIYPHRTDYFYSWTGKSSYLNDSIKVDVTVSGNSVSSYKFSYITPETYSNFNSDIFQGVATIIFYFIIIILIASIAYKKIKAYEIGFKLAFIIAAIVALTLSIHLYVIITAQMGWFILIPIFFSAVFYGGLVFVAWAAGETITREVWKEKLGSTDLLVKGYFLNSNVGESILKGITAGFGIVIIQIFFLFIVQNFTAVTFTSYYSAFSSLVNSSSSSIAVLSAVFYYPMFLVTIFLLFTVSGLRKRIKSPVVLILLAGITWGLVNSSEIYPYSINILLDAITGIFIVWVYYKFDVLMSFVSISTYLITGMILELLCIGHATYTSSAFLIIILLVLVIIYAITSMTAGKNEVNLENLTPAFVKNITERERLQRELEIAKEVQMSFLPRTDPIFPGLEIASRCVPALEVGGDYYDFVITGDKKIGIIIGDVSGKGTQAAFYMTLTKGFLKALSRIAFTPANFLTELNSLFYENVDRGTFISMVYGVIDTENKSFRLARAGHNPVIVKNSFQGKTEFLNSSGLALGLEKGPVFSKNIEEVEIPIASGDVFVFYTDGFTEAMNKLNEEFGENRLVASVENNSGLPAKQILNNIFNEVQSYIGKADQHDDMTMVVVKVV